MPNQNKSSIITSELFEISTNHLNIQYLNYLQAIATNPMETQFPGFVQILGSGYLVFIDENLMEEGWKNNFIDDFLVIIDLAISNKINLIRFAKDGPEYPFLQLWEY